MPEQTPLEYEPKVLQIARGIASLVPRGRSVIIRGAAKAFRCRAPFVAKINNLALEIDLDERVSRTIYAFRAFEPVTMGLFEDLLAPGYTVLDVGANFGLFSLIAAQKIGPSGRVYAFEPDWRNGERLQRNVVRNGFANIEHLPLALSDHEGQITMYLSSRDEDNLGSSSIVEAGGDREAISIEATTLDCFLTSSAITTIDVVKMDIEGAEVQALAGAAQAFAEKRIRNLLLEVHTLILARARCAELLQRLERFGYTVWYVDEELSNPKQPTDCLRRLDLDMHLEQPNPHFLIRCE